MTTPRLRLVLLVFLLIAGRARAEETGAVFRPLSLAVYGSGSLPLGRFGAKDTIGGDANFASFGFGGAVEAMFRIHPMLAVTAMGGWFYNAFDSDALLSAYAIPQSFEYKIEGGDYYSIPLLAGLRFDYPVSPLVGIYVAGQAGAGFVGETEETFTITSATGTDYRGTTESTSGAFFSCSASAGFTVGPGLDLSIRYLNLGNPRLRMQTTSSDSPKPTKYSFKMETVMLLFQAGWRFPI